MIIHSSRSQFIIFSTGKSDPFFPERMEICTTRHYSYVLFHLNIGLIQLIKNQAVHGNAQSDYFLQFSVSYVASHPHLGHPSSLRPTWKDTQWNSGKKWKQFGSNTHCVRNLSLLLSEMFEVYCGFFSTVLRFNLRAASWKHIFQTPILIYDKEFNFQVKPWKRTPWKSAKQRYCYMLQNFAKWSGNIKPCNRNQQLDHSQCKHRQRNQNWVLGLGLCHAWNIALPETSNLG